MPEPTIRFHHDAVTGNAATNLPMLKPIYRLVTTGDDWSLRAQIAATSNGIIDGADSMDLEVDADLFGADENVEPIKLLIPVTDDPESKARLHHIKWRDDLADILAERIHTIRNIRAEVPQFQITIRVGAMNSGGVYRIIPDGDEHVCAELAFEWINAPLPPRVLVHSTQPR